ncbi:hypothetical protein Hanom_Chr12g01125021 [Helianthus anomalus]
MEGLSCIITVISGTDESIGKLDVHEAFVILSCMVSCKSLHNQFCSKTIAFSISCIKTLFNLFPMILMLIVTKVAKSALEKVLAEGVDICGSGAERSSAVEEARVDIHDPLLVKG